MKRREVLRYGALGTLVMAGLAAGIGTLGGIMLLLRPRRASAPAPAETSAPTQPPLPPPPIVSRADWGARPPDHTAPNETGFADSARDDGWFAYVGDLAAVYNTVVIHHTATFPAQDETMADVQALHMDRNGWADVGYHFAIDANGVVYEGRDVHVRGSSVAGHNSGVMGVVLMGNFERGQPTAAQLQALQPLVNWLAQTYALSHLAAHREFNSDSLCPGDNLMPYLDSVAQVAGLQRGTDGYVPPV
jgi:hypothetical protein